MYLKYFLAIKLGEFPKTHSLKRLFMEIKDLCLEAYNIFEENIGTFGDIESAYITSRYFPTEFLEKEISQMLGVADEVRRAIENCL
jgi:HEPN domain-containing protein